MAAEALGTKDLFHLRRECCDFYDKSISPPTNLIDRLEEQGMIDRKGEFYVSKVPRAVVIRETAGSATKRIEAR